MVALLCTKCDTPLAINLALQLGSLAQGNTGVLAVVDMTDLLTLGALLSFVMGAVYQLIATSRQKWTLTVAHLSL